MSHPSIGNEGVNPNFPLDPGLILQGYIGLNPQLYQSSISPSHQESNAVTFTASNPTLRGSDDYMDSTVAYYKLAAKFNNAAAIFLNGWIKSLEQQEEAVKAYLQSAEYLNRLQAKSVTTMTKIEGQQSTIDSIPIKNAVNLENFVSSVPIEVAAIYLQQNAYVSTPSIAAVISEATKIGDTPSTSRVPANSLASHESTKAVEIGPEHFIAASLIIGAGVTAVTQTSVDPVSGSMNAEAKVIQDAYSAILPLQEQSAAVLVASWFSSMWGVAMLSQTSIQSLDKFKNVESKDAKKIDIDYAKTYAETLIGKLQTPEFERILIFLVTKSEENVPVDKRTNPEKVLTQSKIVLLSVALALVAKLDVAGKSDEGWFNELEFEGLITGKTDLSKDDIHGTASIKKLLISEINVELSKLSPLESEEMVRNLKNYFISNPSTENLLNQEKSLAKVMPHLLKPRQFEEAFLDQKSV